MNYATMHCLNKTLYRKSLIFIVMAEIIKKIKAALITSMFLSSFGYGLMAEGDGKLKAKADMKNIPIIPEDGTIFFPTAEEKPLEKKFEDKYKDKDLKDKKIYGSTRTIRTCVSCRRYYLCRKRGKKPLCNKSRQDPEIMIKTYGLKRFRKRFSELRSRNFLN